MKNKALIILSIITIILVAYELASSKINLVPLQNTTIEFKASAKKVVTAGQIFQLSFTVNSQASNFKAPAFNGFTVLSGPSTMTSQSYSYYKGKETREISMSYTYQMVAKSQGTFKIPAAEVTVGDKTYKSEPIEITVVASSNNNANNDNSTNDNQDDIANQVFVRTTLSRNSIFPGEYLIASTKIYTLIDIRDLREINRPKYSGFWIKDILSPQNLSTENEVLNGKTYNTALVNQSIVFAQKQGSFKIEPYEMEITVKQKVGEEIDIFGRKVNRYAYVNKTIKGNTNLITVKPYPQAIPANFSGIVGNSFSINATIDKNKIKTDENINYTVKITGNGNLYLLNEIKTDFPTEFDSYKPQVEDEINYSKSGALGYKNFRYILLAREFGKTKIKPVNFTYFNNITKKFETISGTDFEIEIEKGDHYVQNSNTGTRILNKDIRYINDKNLSLQKKCNNLSCSNKLYYIYLALLLSFLLFAVIRKKIIKEHADIAKIKNKRAAKISQQRLKAAAAFLKSREENKFYSEILKSLNGYLSDKLNINLNFITKSDIKDILLEKGLEAYFAENLITILNTCEYAQYGPVSKNQTPENIYFETEKIINTLENRL